MKTILVTGASQGIGKATAELFLEKGWRVIGTCRKDSCGFSHKNFISINLTLEKTSTFNELFEFLKKEEIKIDVLFNNAGAILKSESTELEEESFLEAVRVNMLGPALLTQGILKQDLLNPSGRIIFNSSRMGQMSGDQYTEVSFPEYKLTKAMLNKYARLLSEQRKDLHISVIHPGSVKTRLTPMNANREPRNVAGDIWWLATSEDIPSGKFWDVEKREIKDW